MADDFSDAVIVEIDEQVAVVSLNRPDRLNAWSTEMGWALFRQMESLAEKSDVRAVVLKGNGRAFCSGVDLKPDVSARIVGRSPAEKVMGYFHRYRGSHRRTQFIEGLPQPIIAAIPAARCSSPRLATAIAAPSRANSIAIALPKPVPPPVINTTSPANVPAGNIAVPKAGGSGTATRRDILGLPSHGQYGFEPSA